MDARKSLKELGMRAGVRTRPANLDIRGAEDYLTVRCSFQLDGSRVQVYANPSLLYVNVKCECGVLFSTPRHDPISLAKSLLGQVAGCDVYVVGDGRASPVPWIYSSEAVAAMGSLHIEEDELLTVGVGGMTAILWSSGPDSDWERLQRLVALSRVLSPAHKDAPLDRERLPEDLRDLFPLIKRWGISDDQVRSDKVERAKTETLRRLLETAESRLPRIAEFLARVAEIQPRAPHWSAWPNR